MKPLRLATVWLSGCSGCHMGLLNLHEDLLELLERCELVYSPLVDAKRYPENVDLALVEGAVGNRENLEMAGIVRARTRLVASLGDCAVNGNLTAERNPFGSRATLETVYRTPPGGDGIPRLLPTVLPLHQVIKVDAFIPGCPPTPEQIRQALDDLIGRTPPKQSN